MLLRSKLTALQGQPQHLSLNANYFPDLDTALSSGWFEAVTPEVHSSETDVVGHDVWAKVANSYQQQDRTDMAEPLILKGLAAGFPDAAWYADAVGKHMELSMLQGASNTLSPSRERNAKLVLALCARLARSDHGVAPDRLEVHCFVTSVSLRVHAVR